MVLSAPSLANGPAGNYKSLTSVRIATEEKSDILNNAWCIRRSDKASPEPVTEPLTSWKAARDHEVFIPDHVVETFWREDPAVPLVNTIARGNVMDNLDLRIKRYIETRGGNIEAEGDLPVDLSAAAAESLLESDPANQIASSGGVASLQRIHKAERTAATVMVAKESARPCQDADRFCRRLGRPHFRVVPKEIAPADHSQTIVRSEPGDDPFDPIRHRLGIIVEKADNVAPSHIQRTLHRGDHARLITIRGFE
jgi:hypothetical protein